MRTALWIAILGVAAQAHDIAADAKVQAYFRVEGAEGSHVLRMIVRAPLKTMRDIEFPVKGPGYLDAARADSLLHDAAVTWLARRIEVYEDGVKLGEPSVAAVRTSVESDKSFAAYGDALAHVRTPSQDGDVVVDQLKIDALLEWPVRSAESKFEIDPKLGTLAGTVLTTLFYLPPGGGVRAFELLDDPGRVPLDPSWWQAVWRFTVLGFWHILEGTDHLLFLLCLVIPFREFKPLLIVVTAFTVAHSITLIASAMSVAPNVLWFPPLIETLIAASILYMALENILGAGSVRRRWIVTFGFGLVHGFGFSFLLHETLQFAGSHLLTSLLAFNVGVEIGQIAVLAVAIPALNLLFKYVDERKGTIILCALIAHTAWHWMMERWETLRKFYE